MNLSTEDIEDLVLFVEHVSELRSSKFAQRVLSPKDITYTWTSGSSRGEFINFDEEECRSFILGCRLLMQDNDRTSIRRVWLMFKDQVKKQEWFMKVNPPRWMLNDYLDTNAIILVDADVVRASISCSCIISNSFCVELVRAWEVNKSWRV